MAASLELTGSKLSEQEEGHFPKKNESKIKREGTGYKF